MVVFSTEGRGDGLGNEVLPGAIPMEDMDLLVHPSTLSVRKNPDSPDIAVSTAGAPGRGGGRL
jgi:hypothetical protein